MESKGRRLAFQCCPYGPSGSTRYPPSCRLRLLSLGHQKRFQLYVCIRIVRIANLERPDYKATMGSFWFYRQVSHGRDPATCQRVRPFLRGGGYKWNTRSLY
jgi:hypothetical protein